MPRTLDPALQTLIDSGHCEDHTTLVLTLGNGTVLRFATAGMLIDGHTFLAELKDNDAFKMSLAQATDRTNLKAQNVDKVLGQTLLGIADALEGATAMLGIAFIDDEGTIYHDDKMPGDVIAGAIDESEVQLRFVGDIYGAQVVGETVASVFPYESTPSSTVPDRDPDDIGPWRDPADDGGGRRGRLPLIFP